MVAAVGLKGEDQDVGWPQDSGNLHCLFLITLLLLIVISFKQLSDPF